MSSVRRTCPPWQPSVPFVNSNKVQPTLDSVTWERHGSFKFTIGHISVRYVKEERFYVDKNCCNLLLLMTHIFIFYSYTQDKEVIKCMCG
jgi:hypothetical protein